MFLLLTLLLLPEVCIITSRAAEIFQYDAPIVTLRAGNAWIINGNLKLVHIINLDDYGEVAENLTALVRNELPPSQTKNISLYYLAQVQERLMELKGTKSRTRRSIDWIGSAWKWIAGNPDATDWNNVLKSQNTIIANNNEQFKINTRLLNKANEVVQKTNELVARINELSKRDDTEQIGQSAINQILVLKDAIDEIIRACQMAKSGIINTNLLDRTEVEAVITEMETLPYSNAVEAIEYGKPSIYTNGTLILYVLSIPKLEKDFYHRLIVRSTIRLNRQVELPFNEVLISQNETFGIKSPCLNINNITVCQQSSLKRLGEESCVPRLLKGGTANCQSKVSKAQVVEMVTSDTVFLTNYIGVITTQDHKELLNGTYLVRLINETILLDNKNFSSTSISRMQPLPPVLTNVVNDKLLVDINDIHNISVRNIDKIEYLRMRSNLSFGGQIGIVLIVGICFGMLWHRMTRRLNLPVVENPRIIDSSSRH